MSSEVTRAGKPQKKGRATKADGASAPLVIDETSRARAETELRNHLSGRDGDFSSAVLARVTGTLASLERKSSELWFDLASRSLCDSRAIEQRVAAMEPVGRLALALLGRTPWWSRSALVQALALAAGGAAASDQALLSAMNAVLSRWPVLVRTNAWTRAEELSLFEPLAVRVRPLLGDTMSIARVEGGAPASIGLEKTLLALALFPGVVAQRRPRVTRGGELHGADATKLERTLGDARGLFATWERLHAFEEVDGALSPISSRARALLRDPRGLAAEYLQAQLGELGWALALITAEAGRGERVELGASLVAIGLQNGFGFGYDVATLGAYLERDGLRFAPYLDLDPKQDSLALPPDVRAAIRGEAADGSTTYSQGYVQPNYEVVIPPGAPLEDVFVIGCATELVHLEAVARLKLTRASVLAARSVGLTSSEIVGSLESLAGARALPPAVRQAVEEWGDAIGEARVRTAILFEVRASDSLRAKVEEDLAAIILDRPAPHLFVLSRAPSPRELTALRSAGILTRSVAAAGRARVDEDAAAKPASIMTVAKLTGEVRPPRDLKRALDPHRILALVEASRGKARAPGATQSTDASGAGAMRTPTAVDPDEGTERDLPEQVAAALTERTMRWRDRSDWANTLRSIAGSPAFRRAASASAPRLAVAIERATDPYVLQMSIARIDAEISMRRATDG